MSARLLILFWLAVGCGCRPQNSTPAKTFQQKRSRIIDLPPSAGKAVLRILPSDEGVVVITRNGVFPYHDGVWRSDSMRVPVEQAVYDPSGTLWLSNSKNLFTTDNRQVIDLSALADPVTQFFWDLENQLYAATTDGLYWMADTWQPITPLKGRLIHALVQDADSTLWVATSDGLWQRKKSNGSTWTKR